MPPLALLLACLLAIPVLALPVQQHLSRPQRLAGPKISPAPYGDMVGVSFRVLDPGGSGGVGRWRVVESFLPVGVKVLVEDNPGLPARPEALLITSVPNDGLHVRRQCVVFPSDDGEGRGGAEMVVVGDEDGEVPLYGHSEGGVLGEEQDAVAYACY